MDVDEVLGINRRDPLAQRARILEAELVGMLHDLEDVRKANDLSQADVARDMGVDPSYISRIENGRQDLRLSTLKRYAWAVGATLRVAVNNHARDRLMPNDGAWVIHSSELSDVWVRQVCGVHDHT